MSTYFINPWFLLGLGGILVPIIIHLLTRYRPKRVDWAAMELLRRALMVRSRQIRLEDLLLLVLRCLAIALLALALARPRLSVAGARALGAKTHAAVVVALDGSFSMSHGAGLQKRFDRAKQRARDVLGTLEPGSPVTMVLMGQRPRILLRNVGYDPARFDELLQNTRPLPERLNLENCLEELAPLVRELKSSARECYLITDAQTITWGQVSDKAALTLKEIDSLAKVFLISTAIDGAENLAVTRFELASGAVRAGDIARYVAEVRNHGGRPAENVSISLTLDGVPVDRRVVSLDPGQTRSVPLFAHFDKAGLVKLSAKVERDQLEWDNVRRAVARVRQEVRILCVDGQPSNVRFEGETDYVATMLIPKARGRRRGGRYGGGLFVKQVPWLDLPGEQLSEYEVVILANVPDLGAEQVTALRSFVRAGGGLMVFLGGNVDPEIFNPRMKHKGVSILPAELVAATGEPDGSSKGWPVSLTAVNHPVARALGGTHTAAQLAEARVLRFFKVRPLAGARVVLGLAGQEWPLLVERALGRGRVMLFASTADREWNNLPLSPVFPILMQQSVTYLTRRAYELPLEATGPVVLPLPADVDAAGVTFQGPDGRRHPARVTQRAGRPVAELTEPPVPGFYDVVAGGGGEAVALAVNADRVESDVRCLQGAELSAAMAGVPVKLLTVEQDIPKTVKESRVGRELWRWFLILALCMFALEALLAKFFSWRVAGEQEKVSVGRTGLADPAGLKAAG